jgi:hypothetical protein
MSGDYARFPPGGYVWVPGDDRRGAAAGLALYAPCRPRAVAAQQAAWLAVRLAGPRVLPGPRAVPDGLGPDELAPLRAAWAAVTGPADTVALYLQPQRSRGGFAALLLDRGEPRAFVKVRRNPDGVAREERVLRAVAGKLRTVAAPEVLGAGTTGDWHWLATSTLPAGPHRPFLPRTAAAARAVLDDLSQALTGALAPEPGVPAHWRPAHGDATPWNLRRRHRRVWAIDWEDARWAPPEADLVYLAAACAAQGRPIRDLDLRGATEAGSWWRAIVAERPGGEHDPGFNQSLLQLLPGS